MSIIAYDMLLLSFFSQNYKFLYKVIAVSRTVIARELIVGSFFCQSVCPAVGPLHYKRLL
jgi:hypothetical protein